MRTTSMLAAILLLSATGAHALQPGSVVIYSDGSAEKLLARDKQELHWEDARKRHIVRSTNPALPVLSRKDFLGGKSYTAVVSRGQPDALLTLPPGSRVEFAMLRTKHDGEKSIRNWECVHLGSSKREVLGKVRRLEDYSCERFKIHRKLWNRQFRERRDFSYSPELDVTVELKRQTRTKTSTRKLVAVLSPGEANYRNIRKAIAKALSNK